MNNDSVLSYGTDPAALARRERALRKEGYKVFSIATEGEARFEIEMGRCGVLLICLRTSEDAVQDLSTLSKRSCPHGTIIFVMNGNGGHAPKGVDYVVPESAQADAVVQTLGQCRWVAQAARFGGGLTAPKMRFISYFPAVAFGF
jgi:hypothetical protein